MRLIVALVLKGVGVEAISQEEQQQDRGRTLRHINA